MIREPAVAGSFYPREKKSLHDMLVKLMKERSRKKVIAVMSPHAGYIYSGGVAGALFSAIEIPATVLILAPNHYGYSVEFALWPRGKWRTPMGDAPISDDLNRFILEHAPQVEEETSSHLREHSAEVQLPFLQYVRPEVQVSVIGMSAGTSESLVLLGKGLASAITTFGKEVLIVASSDMTHYESQERARKQDNRAIERILALDAEGLYDTVRKNRISMCGLAPTVTMIAAAKQLGATQAELIKYQTSGDVTGDYAQVVGYAGIAVW